MYVSKSTGLLIFRDINDAAQVYEVIGFDPSDGLYMITPLRLWGTEGVDENSQKS